MTLDPMQWLREQIAATRVAAEAVPADQRAWTADAAGNVYVQDSNVGIAFGPWDGDLGETGQHIAGHDPQAVLDLCESHTAILDHIERYGVPVVEIDSQFDGDFFGKTFVALRAQDLLRHVGIAYRHNPGYDEFVDSLTAPQVTAQLSDIAHADELAARRADRTPRPDDTPPFR
jgi:hypothetical protein